MKILTHPHFIHISIRKKTWLFLKSQFVCDETSSLLQSWALSLKACDLPRGLDSESLMIIGILDEKWTQIWWKMIKHDGNSMNNIWWKHYVRNEWNHSQTFLGKKQMNGTPKSNHSCRITSQAPLILISRQGTQRPLHCGESDNLMNQLSSSIGSREHLQETIPSLYLWTQRLPIESCRVPLKPLGICYVRCPKSWHFRNPHQRTASVLLKQLQEWPRLVDLGEFVQLPTVINSNQLSHELSHDVYKSHLEFWGIIVYVNGLV